MVWIVESCIYDTDRWVLERDSRFQSFLVLEVRPGFEVFRQLGLTSSPNPLPI